MPGPSAELAPITDADVAAVAAFLHAHLNERVPAHRWEEAMRAPWQRNAPNHGFLLRADGAVVGAYLALYSERVIRGAREPFCNLAAWCVLEPFRFHSLKLVKALIAQPDYHFTDLSPSGNVVPLNRRLKFVDLDTTTALAPNLPWPGRRGSRMITKPNEIGRVLEGDALRVYVDHADAPAVRHLVVVDGDRRCHVMFRRDRRKSLPLFASIVYASDPVLLRRHWRGVASHLLLRHAIPVTLAERRVLGFAPRPSRLLRAPRAKMYKSDHLGADDIDYLYSEMVALSW